jgi:hypothetical protein
VQYDPPASLTPAEAGTLMDYSADMRDITATLVDLAVRGHLRIEEKDDPTLLGLSSRREYVFRRLESPNGEKPLEDHERRILNGIFEGGKAEVELSDLKNEFYRHLPFIKDSIFARLVGRGLYRSHPDNVRSNWRVGAMAFGIVVFGAGSVLGARLGLTPVPFFVAAIMSAIILLAFAQEMPARTVAGARALERVLGFEEFLERVEKERLDRVVKTPEMFEKFLPYAMAFGVDRKWARGFQDIYRVPPKWYVGSNATSFDLGGFSSRLADMSDRTRSVMTSAPRSSGGSGFSSGGSSGGGSGGGGGGGW